MQVSQYAKAIVAVIGAIVAVLAEVLADDVIGPDEWQTLIVGVITAVFVYLVPNKPAPEPTG